MIRGFSTRKIEGQKTLGEQLKSVRESLELSIQDAENGSKVRARFLISLESGDWTNLPTPVYVRGFVLAYAKFLGISKEEIIRLYEAELSLKKTQNPSEFSYKNNVKDAKVILTPKVLGYALLSTFILIMFGYIFYQVMDFAGSPNLQVSTPSNNLVLETDSTDIRGLTDSDNIISINNETIPVTNDGRFSTSLKLHRGVNVVKVKALNKAKKETTNVITIEYKPKTAANFEVMPQQN